MIAAYFGNGAKYPPKGILGGETGRSSEAYKITEDGEKVALPLISDGEEILPGELIGSYNSGGGGYGNPLERDPEMVRDDVKRGFVSEESAREEYGVILHTQNGKYIIDEEETKRLRNRLRTEGSK
jgi:N-methylhydantoinase B